MMGVVREPFHLETVFLLGWSLAMDNIPSLPYTWVLGVRCIEQGYWFDFISMYFNILFR